MKNEFTIDPDILQSFTISRDLLSLYELADKFSIYALNNFNSNKELLKQAGNKYYTCAFLIENNYPKNNPKTLLDFFLSQVNYCYFQACSFFSKYSTLVPFNYDLTLYYDTLAEKYIEIAIHHETEIINSPLITNHDKTVLLDYKHRKLVLKVNKLDNISTKAIIEDDPKSSFRFLINAIDAQKEVLEFARINGDKFDISREEANLLSKEIKLEACRAELILLRIKKGIETKKDSFEEIIGNYIAMTKTSKVAYKTNPNSDKFRDSYLELKKELIQLLQNSKPYWFSYLIKFENEKEIEDIMKEIDVEKYKLEKAKLELKEKPIKQIVLIGSFYTFMFLAILLSIVLIANLKLPFYVFFFSIILAIVSYVCLNAFILKSVNSLSEEGLIKILELAFKFPIAGLKSFSLKKSRPKGK
jgi:hypothetical protein